MNVELDENINNTVTIGTITLIKTYPGCTVPRMQLTPRSRG